MLRVKLYWRDGTITESIFKNYRDLNDYSNKNSRDLEKSKIVESFKNWRG